MKREQKWIVNIQRKQNKKYADLLVRTYYNEIFVYAYKQLGCKETALDLTQEIFISMLQSIKGYDSRKASFRTWLYRVATNKIIDYRRSREWKTPQMIGLDEFDIPNESDFVRQFEQQELLSAIEAYICTVDSNYQEIFRLRFFGEFTLAEIASILYQPEATVKTRYYHLLKNLRKEFYNEYTDSNR